MVSGHTVRIRSGSPESPSQQVITTSWMPRLRSSVSIVIHRFAPHTGRSDPQSEHVAFAVEVDADRNVDGPVGDLRLAQGVRFVA